MYEVDFWKQWSTIAVGAEVIDTLYNLAISNVLAYE